MEESLNINLLLTCVFSFLSSVDDTWVHHFILFTHLTSNSLQSVTLMEDAESLKPKSLRQCSEMFPFLYSIWTRMLGQKVI